MGCCVQVFLAQVRNMDLWGGEVERGCLREFSGYSETAQRIGKPSYLEPISQSLQKRQSIGHVLERKQRKTMLKTHYEPIWSVLEIVCRNQ
jgi:hypothetical protein